MAADACPEPVLSSVEGLVEGDADERREELGSNVMSNRSRNISQVPEIDPYSLPVAYRAPYGPEQTFIDLSHISLQFSLRYALTGTREQRPLKVRR